MEVAYTVQVVRRDERIMVVKKDNYAHWLEENRYNKLMGQTKLVVGQILNPLRMYGQEVFVDGAMIELMHLFEVHGKVLRGIDVPIERRRHR